jgi:hypothetical protein
MFSRAASLTDPLYLSAMGKSADLLRDADERRLARSVRSTRASRRAARG